MRKKTINQKGVTLVELLVVIAIIAILAVIGISALNPNLQFQRGRDQTRKADLAKFQASLEQYFNDNSSYPYFSGGGDSQTNTTPAIGALNTSTITSCSGQSQLLNSSSFDSTYNTSFSKDPNSTTTPYLYEHYAVPNTANTTYNFFYYMFANLENSNDPDAKKCKPKPTGISCSTACPTDPTNECISVSIPNSSYCTSSRLQTYNYWLTNQ